ncbi:MAG: methylenetetrahydrofolate reductase, partial [Deltaproteobacteria bacterium]|nr:methylenetetrahydrofolate reductase [Deltaproteobacteria bacterium]
MFQENVLNPSTFCVTWEQIPGRGAVERQQEDIIINAEKARQSGKIHAIGITDNPGGNPALAVDLLCAELKRTGMEPLVHFACRDKNRNAIESMLYGLERSQARNLLLLSGDYPSNEGFGGTSRPVFDLDPVNALQLVAEMNKGFKYQNLGKPQQLTPTQFFAGVGISPFKASEAELAGQYYKLRKKIAAGAKFAITQIGYDARKIHELLQWLKLNKFDLPVLANLFVLPFGAAKIMKANKIPGCVIPDGLLARLEEESKAPDKGKGARIMRAAEFYAVAKGLGCAGAHIGGHNISCDTVLEVIDRGEELSPNWRDVLAKFDYSNEPTFFYYYKRDEATTLNRQEENPRPEKA